MGIDTEVSNILSTLSAATVGTSHQLFTEEELLEFAVYYAAALSTKVNEPSPGAASAHTTSDAIVRSFLDYWFDTGQTVRRCTCCGRLMRNGYCLDMGRAYYCSDTCLHDDFTEEEWLAECDANDQSYYTEWY